MTTHRRLLLLLLGLGPLTSALAACGPTEAKNGAAPPLAPVAIASAPAESRRLPAWLDVTGTLMADAQTDVAAEQDGRIVRVLVERGSHVGAGVVIAEQDREEAAARLREAEASEAETRARLGLLPGAAFDPAETPEVRRAAVVLARAEADFQRFARLVDEGAVSRSEYDAKRAEAQAAREQHEETLNQVRQLYQALQAQQARVALARKALADTEIRAPWAGLVAQRRVEVGDYVKKGAAVATLVRVDPLRVELTVPEAAVAAVRTGQRVSFTVQAQPGRSFHGAIAYVGPALRAESRALIAEAIVPNPARALQPGLFVTAGIELPGAAPSVVVPADAVRTENGVSRLFVVRDGRAELRFVQLGRELGGALEVVRGVQAGERVAVAGLDGLSDGAAVADRGGP
jgi:membrane fusion protein (multidrug efflux system)